MDNINTLYAQLLHVGFIVLRQAIDAKDWEWADKERELLHNVPSLMNESNMERHKCFWLLERPRYIEWVSARGGEPRSRMMTYYAPLWKEMEPVIQEFLASPVCRSE